MTTNTRIQEKVVQMIGLRAKAVGDRWGVPDSIEEWVRLGREPGNEDVMRAVGDVFERGKGATAEATMGGGLHIVIENVGMVDFLRRTEGGAA
jgi:hypothetical protein